MTKYPKRLIEVDLPIKRISAHARREKSIRHGHISTLHIWWARRPLAACRAVICASLWPDPVDPICPQVFRDKAAKIIFEFAQAAANNRKLGESCDHETWIKWQALAKTSALDSRNEAHWNILRYALLDFIADFANWDNSTVQEYLETSRALTQASHEALGGEPGTRPLVVDPFAGGGSIPLEALRVGADAFASDLNPIPVLLNKVVLEYIPKYGKRLADEVRRSSEWIKKEAEKELSSFFPDDQDGSTPIAYLWARTARCEGPGCGAELPLIRDKRLWHFNFGNLNSLSVSVEVGKESHAQDRPTVAGGSVTCPRPTCRYTTPANAVRAQLTAKHGGATDARLLAVYVEKASGGRTFRNPTESDRRAILLANEHLRTDELPTDEINPTRPYKNTRGLSAVTRIGITRFADLYTLRQAAVIQCFQSILARLPGPSNDSNFRTAVLATLSCAVSRFIFQNCSLSRWNAARSTIEGAFGKQALQVVWDFAEVNPLSDGPANWNGAVDWVLKVLDANQCLNHAGTVVRGRAQDRNLPVDSAEAIVTDPPYFAAIPYSDLSNVFFVWERTFYRNTFPELFSAGLVGQEDEIIVTNANLGVHGSPKDATFYKREMVRALEAARSALKPHGIGVVVFAESSTSSWEVMLGAVIEAGWLISGSWPIDTELQTRTQAAGSASLQSSIHIVCRPRETGQLDHRPDIGDWRDILQELPLRIHEWMPRLASEGVVGADAIFACLGPALEVFSRYSRVEKASGEPVALGEYLEHVWAAVAKEALALVFEGADATGFEPDARLTAMWLWTLNAPDSNGKDEDGGDDEDSDDEQEGKKPKITGFKLEYDAARKIAQGHGAHLESLTHLVEVSGVQARLLPVSERTKHLFGKDEEEPARAAGRKKSSAQLNMFAELTEAADAEVAWKEKTVKRVGETALDRVHQAMILFAAGRGEALKRFVVEDGVGQDGKFWRLAQALSALYPSGTDEKRWVDGVLARKKQFGF
jgi:adenine-specific DNA methylase